MNEDGIRELFAIWQERLGLERWHILIEFIDNPLEFQQLQGSSLIDFMITEPEWKYAKARITVNGHAIEHADHGWVTEAVVHELVHCLLHPVEIAEWLHLQLSGDAIQSHMEHIEMVATNIARSFVAAYAGKDALRELSNVSLERGMYEPEPGDEKDE